MFANETRIQGGPPKGPDFNLLKLFYLSTNFIEILTQHSHILTIYPDKILSRSDALVKSYELLCDHHHFPLLFLANRDTPV